MNAEAEADIGQKERAAAKCEQARAERLERPVGRILGGKRQERHPEENEQIEKERPLRDLVHASKSAVVAHPHDAHQTEGRGMDDQRRRDVAQSREPVAGGHLQIQHQQRQYDREDAVAE